jgi:Cytochrome c554 and c-prime
MRFLRVSLVILAGCVVAALGRAQEPARPAASRTAVAFAAARFRGAGSCSATACHGSIKSAEGAISRVRRNEHTTWMSFDPHARAFQVLFDDRSERIERGLEASEGRYTKASEDVRCLVCHTTPRPPSELPATAWLNADGVGCESCHGPSERWFGAHTTLAWHAQSRDEKEAQWGLWNTKNLARRASICAGCHVGDHSADGLTVRDVNHDLIAAGHPRLNFEFSSSLDNLPEHWDEKDENAGTLGSNHRSADFPARAWAIGRLAGAKAAIALLERRVAEADGVPEPLAGPDSVVRKRAARWPELSEYGCFSCHHDLRDQAWRRGPRQGGVALGSPRWGTWILPATKELLEEFGAKPEKGGSAAMLEQLVIAMEKPVALAQIGAAAREAVGALEACQSGVAARRFDVATIERLIERIDDREAWGQVTSWDEATGRYLALVPLCQSWLASTGGGPSPKQEALRKRLAALLERLKFPTGFDSPAGFEADRLFEKR